MIDTGKRLSIPLAQIIPDPDQPRLEFDPQEIRELADDIKLRGQQQPINVRQGNEATQYIIISGERRFHALSLLQQDATEQQNAVDLKRFSTIDAINRGQNLNPVDILAIQLSENIKRVGFTDFEKALAFERYVNLKSPMTRDFLRSTVRAMRDNKPVPSEMSKAITEACGILSVTVNHLVTRALPLLEYPEDIKQGVKSKIFSSEAAFYLNRVKDVAARAALIKKLKNGLTIAELIPLTTTTKTVNKASKNPKVTKDQVQSVLADFDVSNLPSEKAPLLEAALQQFYRSLVSLGAKN
jgi:ParB family transcriptional regulator, chromosome partitioning protein